MDAVYIQLTCASFNEDRNKKTPRTQKLCFWQGKSIVLSGNQREDYDCLARSRAKDIERSGFEIL